MKCPLKFRLEPFEGGQECDPECAWRRGEGCAVNVPPVYHASLPMPTDNETLRKVKRVLEEELGTTVVTDRSVSIERI